MLQRINLGVSAMPVMQLTSAEIITIGDSSSTIVVTYERFFSNHCRHRIACSSSEVHQKAVSIYSMAHTCAWWPCVVDCGRVSDPLVHTFSWCLHVMV